MKPIRIAVLALAVLSIASVASAQVLAGYMTVDAVSVGTRSIEVRGVVQGDVSPTTRTVTFLFGAADEASSREACHRLLLLALSKPGQYVVKAGPNTCTVALVKP